MFRTHQQFNLWPTRLTEQRIKSASLCHDADLAVEGICAVNAFSPVHQTGIQLNVSLSSIGFLRAASFALRFVFC